MMNTMHTNGTTTTTMIKIIEFEDELEEEVDDEVELEEVGVALVFDENEPVVTSALAWYKIDTELAPVTEYALFERSARSRNKE